MDHLEAGDFWNNNAEAWTALARAGYDLYRDYLNTPAFFANLPIVDGLSGLDVGCGEGHNTRLLARQGALMRAVDIAPVFIRHAQEEEKKHPLGIQYRVASAVELPFEDGKFDFATAFMCLMDIPETEKALQEVFRVLKPGAFFQFSITHPCYATPHRKNLRDTLGNTYAVEIGGYFDKLNGRVEEWIFGAAPHELKRSFSKFKVPVFNRTLSEWVNLLIACGFVLEMMHEPCPGAETVRQMPYLQDSSVVAYFLHVRCRKPG